jgi:hypothetical protein
MSTEVRPRKPRKAVAKKTISPEAMGPKAAEKLKKFEPAGTDDSAPPKQQAFEGDGFPEKPPKEVEDARDEYVSAMRAHAKAGQKKAERHEKLIEVMHKHGIDRVRLDGENKFFEIVEEEKIKTKTVPKEERERRAKSEE